jgi:non-heme chloroperoxidase
LPIDVFDQIRAGVAADRSQFWKDLSLPFYGYNRPGREDFGRRARIILAARDDGRLPGLLLLHQGVFRNGSDRGPEENRRADAHPARRRRSDRADRRLGLLSSKIVKNATLKVYKGAPHGMCTTLKDQVNEDLLAFIKA